MFAKLFELACFHIVKAAERGGWEPKAPRPVPVVPEPARGRPRVRLERRFPVDLYSGGYAVDGGGKAIATWWLICADSDIGPETWGHAILGGGAGDAHGSEREAIDAIVAELSTWAEVDTGEAA